MVMDEMRSCHQEKHMAKVLLLENPTKNVQHYETKSLIRGRRGAIIEDNS